MVSCSLHFDDQINERRKNVGLKWKEAAVLGIETAELRLSESDDANNDPAVGGEE